MLTRILVFVCAAPVWAAAPLGCPAGAPVGVFRIQVKPPRPGPLLVLESLNRILPGSTIVYTPAMHPLNELKNTRVALVLSPADDSAVEVMPPQPAAKVAEWPVTKPVAVAALVWGPQGLDRGKVESLVTKDKELVEQLADYAQKTEQAEALLAALDARNSGDATQSVDATLSAFGAQYNAGEKIDRNAPLDQQSLATIRAMNPAVAAYDPLAQQTDQRLRQSAGLAASAVSLFFGPSVGLAATGGALFVNLRTLAFPRMEFRSALSEKGSHDEQFLCAKHEPPTARTRLAYLWAVRIPNAPPPTLTLAGSTHVALGVKNPLAVTVGNGTWGEVARGHGWKLVSSNRKGEFVAPLTINAAKKDVELDLTNARVPAGDYTLRAKWDWDDLPVGGSLHVHALSNLEGARLTPASRDRLVTGAGKVGIEITGPDFEFVRKVALTDPRERYGEPVTLNFTLPEGLRGGPQMKLDAEVDTHGLIAGGYKLLLTQVDDKVHAVPLRVLPPPPALAGNPLPVNLQEKGQEPAPQRVVLHGSGLSRIKQIRCEGAAIALNSASGDLSRDIDVTLSGAAHKGDRLTLNLTVQDMDAPVVWPAALEVVGPRPVIDHIETSLPAGLGVNLRKGEIPAGAFVSFVLSARNFASSSTLRLACSEDSLTLHPLTIRVGEQRADAALRRATAGSLFLSFDPGAIGQSGCSVVASLVNRVEGWSQPKALGNIVRLPRIDSFELTDEKAGESNYIGILKGRDLDLISQVGWDAATGIAVDALPAPVAGEALRQSLRVAIPWPSPAPHSPLYIWLRGETGGRATSVRY